MEHSSGQRSPATESISAAVPIQWLLLVPLAMLVVKPWIAMSQILTFLVLAIIAPHPAGRNLSPLLITTYWVPDVGKVVPLFLLVVLFAVVGAERIASCLVALAIEAVELGMMALLSAASMIYVGCLAVMHAFAWICTVVDTVESIETPQSAGRANPQSPNLRSPNVHSSDSHSQRLHPPNPPSAGRRSWKRRGRA